jgi:hypothetical protein
VPAIEALVNIAAAKASLLPNNITLLPEVTAILSTTKLPSVDLSAITSMLKKPNIDLSGLTVSGFAATQTVVAYDFSCKSLCPAGL